MTILFVDQFSDLGGAQRCLLDVVEAALGYGWRAHAALPGDGPLVRALADRGVPVAPIRCGPFASGRKTAADALRFAAQYPRLKSEISRLIYAHSPDLIYVNGPRPMPAVCSAAGRTPVLFHSHSLLPSKLAWLVSHSLKKAGRATVVACSRFVAAPLCEYLPAAMVQVIYNGVPDCSRPASAKRAAPAIGVIGRIAPEKGQLAFVRAARILSREVAGASFLICGEPLFPDARARRYHEAVRRAADGLPVTFSGWRDDVGEVLAHLDLLVAPSAAAESTPRVILEAFSAGVPVVAFASGGIPEIVKDEVTGFLVAPQTPEALAGTMRDLLVDRTEEAAAVARRARAAWEEKFTVSRFQRQILGAIQKMISCSAR